MAKIDWELLTPMKIIKKNTKKKQVSAMIEYLDYKKRDWEMTSVIDLDMVENHDFSTIGDDDGNVNLLTDNGVRFTNVVGIIDREILKVCPNCKRVKNFSKFGFRINDGKIFDQSRCIDCR